MKFMNTMWVGYISRENMVLPSTPSLFWSTPLRNSLLIEEERGEEGGGGKREEREGGIFATT